MVKREEFKMSSFLAGRGNYSDRRQHSERDMDFLLGGMTPPFCNCITSLSGFYELSFLAHNPDFSMTRKR